MVDAKTNYEAIEEARSLILEEMKKYGATTPEYLKCVNALKILSDINGGWETRENTRLDNNRKNDIEEDKVANETAKIEAEKINRVIRVCEDITWFAGGTFIAPTLMYNMDETKQAYRGMTEPIKELRNKLINRK